MTIKQKFNSIDQSKLTADQKAFLTKIKDVTKNFTDSEMNKKVEAPLNGFIEKAKEKMPEAIKSAPVKRTAKATASQTKKPKRTAMSLAKEIRKEGESWNDARARASKMMKEDSKDLSKTVETELDKLSKLVRGQKNKAKLVGISGTNIKRDASRKAKPRGLRTVTNSGETSNQYGTFNNKLGRKYYENRDRHSDRLAPNYPKNSPYLAGGGGVGDYDVKLLVGRRLVYEKKSNTMTKAQNIANEIFSFADDGFDYTIVGYDSSNNKLFEKKRMMANDLPNSLNVNFNSLKLLVTVLDPKQTKLDVGSFTSYKSLLNVVDDFEENNFRITINGKTIEEEFARGGGVRKVGNREYSYGRNWTNDHRHLNKDEDHEVKYTRKGKFMGIFADGGKMAYGGGVGETPRIYVADLEAYNNGKLVGEWLDLADYNDADELMDAIQDVLKKSGGEEYAIHDVEYIPSSMYSEYMGRKDFEELYEMIDLAKQNDLPLEVVQEVVSQYSASAVDDFVGKYDSAEDFAEQLVDEMGGLENFSSPEYYVDITNTDRRLLAGEMADSYVDDIRDEDGGNRVIEQSGLDLDEYEEADSERQQEMLDEAVEIVREEYYDTWYEGLSDPYEFLVEEQGMYSPEDLFNASFIRIDYEKLARDLEQDYTFIQYDGSLYVFNIR